MANTAILITMFNSINMFQEGPRKLCKPYDNNLQHSLRSHTLETGFSDFHLMIYTMLKTKFNKALPKVIKYGEYNRFSEANFFTDLSNVTRETSANYDNFECLMECILEKHALTKKATIRGYDRRHVSK